MCNGPSTALWNTKTLCSNWSLWDKLESNQHNGGPLSTKTVKPQAMKTNTTKCWWRSALVKVLLPTFTWWVSWSANSDCQQEGTYRNQSTAMMRVMSSVGSPTEVSTITMVTRPAWGMPAAPMLAAVAVILSEGEREINPQSLSLKTPVRTLVTWWW